MTSNKYGLFNIDKNRHKIALRLKSVFLLFVIIFSSLISTTIVFNNNASAADSIVSKHLNDPKWQVMSILYIRAISDCINGDSNWINTNSDQMPAFIDVESAKSGEWFYKTWPQNKAIIGEYAKDTFSNKPDKEWSGELKCKDTSKTLISNALKLWGLDPITVLCNSGFISADKYISTGDKIDYNQSVEDCIQFSSKPNSTSLVFASGGEVGQSDQYTFLSYIKNAVYGSASDPVFNDFVKYYALRHLLNEGCISGIDTTPPDESNNFNVNKGIPDVEWIDDTGKNIIKGSYETSNFSGPEDSVTLGYLRWFVLEGEKMTCKEIVSSMNKNMYAQKAVAFMALGGMTPITKEVGEVSKSEGTTCAIEGMGWIICPVVRVLSSAVDGSWGILQGFLQTSPSIVSSGGTTYEAWTLMRNIANAAFVIVFLIIIFSQMTSLGITNYGIKKLLPKLIISAILVNLSFYICQVAVDLSNIIGYSVDGLFKSVSDQMTVIDLPNSATGASGTFAGIAGGILGTIGGGAIIWASIGVLIPALLSAIVALVMILFILVARQALIILLVVLSPLAFVAFLLPNTEKLFKSWQKMMMSMLMLFPIIAVVVGASGLASDILKDVFFTSNSSSLATGTVNWIGQIAAAIVGIIPLFIVPGLLKKSMDGVGGIGKMINGIGSKAGAGAGKWGTSKYQNSAMYRGKETRKAAKAQFKNRIYSERVQKGGFAKFAATGLAATAANGIANSKTGRKIMASRLGQVGLVKNQMGSLQAQQNAVTNAARSNVEAANAKDLSDQTQILNSEIAEVRASGGSVDDFLVAQFNDNSAPMIRRKASVNALAAQGRDKYVREIRDANRGNPEMSRMIQQAISANAGALSSKAPDLVKNNLSAAFDNVKGSDLAGFTKGTAEVHMKYLSSLYDAAATTTAGSNEWNNFNHALDSFNSSVEDIIKTPALQSSFGSDTGQKILETIDPRSTATSAAFKTFVNSTGRMHGLSAIQTDGKIR